MESNRINGEIVLKARQLRRTTPIDTRLMVWARRYARERRPNGATNERRHAGIDTSAADDTEETSRGRPRDEGAL